MINLNSTKQLLRAGVMSGDRSEGDEETWFGSGGNVGIGG